MDNYDQFIAMDEYGEPIQRPQTHQQLLETTMLLPSGVTLAELLDVVRSHSDILHEQHDTLLKQNQVLSFLLKRLKAQGAQIVALETKMQLLEANQSPGFQVYGVN